jgi:hypothetical protein
VRRRRRRARVRLQVRRRAPRPACAGAAALARPPEEEDRIHGLLWEQRLPARERLVADARLVDDLAERLRRRFEPTSAEVALTEARRIGGMAGSAAARGIDALRRAR